MYLAADEDVSDQIVDPVEWWKAHAGDLKNWAKTSRQSSHHLQQQKGYFLYFYSLFATAEIIIRRLYSTICNVTVDLAISML